MRSIFCSDCGRVFDRRSYTEAYCRGCKSNRENRQRRKDRVDVINKYGGQCVCCGETEIDFLTFDHINNDGWTERTGLNGRASGGAIIVALKKEMRTDIQILCYNCNCARQFSPDRICPHQR
jgi:hypothetical protein